MMKRRLLSAIMLALFGCSCMVAQKFTAVNAEGVKIKYEVLSTSNKTVQVIGGSNSEKLIIPASVEYNGLTYKVTAIKKRAFCNTWRGEPGTMRKLVLPEGLLEIGEYAFARRIHNNGYSILYIPSSVKHIGEKGIFSSNGKECNHLQIR